mgnify:FL=1
MEKKLLKMYQKLKIEDERLTKKLNEIDDTYKDRLAKFKKELDEKKKKEKESLTAQSKDVHERLIYFKKIEEAENAYLVFDEKFRNRNSEKIESEVGKEDEKNDNSLSDESLKNEDIGLGIAI